ncbi:MAG TPA: hypothetical protein PLI45_04700 [Candidatus Woesebacteria bacterium]|nr:hypothetical protein [Candidatus Woesebacteria bacterium]
MSIYQRKLDEFSRVKLLVDFGETVQGYDPSWTKNKRTVEVYFVCFSNRINGLEVISEMDKMGLRPAEAQVLKTLFLRSDVPEFVVAFGSTRPNSVSGKAEALCLHYHNFMSLGVEGDWNPRWCFLAVKK